MSPISLWCASYLLDSPPTRIPLHISQFGIIPVPAGALKIRIQGKTGTRDWPSVGITSTCLVSASWGFFLPFYHFSWKKSNFANFTLARPNFVLARSIFHSAALAEHFATLSGQIFTLLRLIWRIFLFLCLRNTCDCQHVNWWNENRNRERGGRVVRAKSAALVWVCVLLLLSFGSSVAGQETESHCYTERYTATLGEAKNVAKTMDSGQMVGRKRRNLRIVANCSDWLSFVDFWGFSEPLVRKKTQKYQGRLLVQEILGFGSFQGPLSHGKTPFVTVRGLLWLIETFGLGKT